MDTTTKPRPLPTAVRRRSLRGLVALLLLVAAPAWAEEADRTPGVPASAAGAAAGGVVAASHPRAAEAGALLLEQGGNAVDAAAAILFALNVVEPEYSGLGGGGFMMVHLAGSGETFVVDSREEAPAAATPDMFGDLTFPVASTSGVSVGVPGALHGIATALDRWGTKPLAAVLEPAIGLAERGFVVDRVLAANVRDTTRGVEMTALQPETAAVFRPGGTPLRAGAILRQPELARTFRLLARHGPAVFYEGPIARAIVEAQRRSRAGAAGAGRMTLADLAEYRARIREPVVGTYRGTTVASAPPPSSGGLTLLQMLGIVERFPMGDPSQGFGFGATRTLHVMIEAMRLAFADRARWMGDDDFVHVPRVGLLARPYVAGRSALVHLDAAMAEPPAGDPLPYEPAPSPRPRTGARPGAAEQPAGHTTHFAVVDRAGNVVTYTNTIESLFGSGILVPGYGFLLNNELTDFNLRPARDAARGDLGANDVAPRKRPRSSMAPTLLLRDGRPFAAYGSPGGPSIINTVFQITLDLLDHGMTIQQAVDAPRISVSSAAGKVSCEAAAVSPLGFSPKPPLSKPVLDALRTMGHAVPECDRASIGSVQAVVVDLRSGARYGAADGRREGTVLRVADARPPATGP